MKYIKEELHPDIEVISVEDFAFNTCTADSKWRPENDIFVKTYVDIISEWSKDLFTPKPLLDNIISHIYETYKPILLHYSLNEILKMTSVDWKHYKKFKNSMTNFNPSKFGFFILYYKSPWEATERTILKRSFKPVETAEVIRQNLSKGKAAFCIQVSDPTNPSCMVVINGDIIDNKNASLLEQKIDHELNHYFKKYCSDEDEYESLDLSARIEKIGRDAGYNLSNPLAKEDFIDHMLDKSEFIPMIANVCNILESKCQAEDKFEWLIDHSTSSFLKSSEYMLLNGDLQNILLFTTICRAYSQKRWARVLNALKIQFDKKESFKEKTKCSLLTFIEKLKGFCG